jgi:hypothetical protein
MMGADPTLLEDPALDPRGLFETVVKPELVSSCQGCHAISVQGINPFLTQGSEYASITTYQNGKFIPSVADQSLLLTKGAHQGPALTQAQHDKVLAWLEGEVLARGKANSSPTTPTVAIRTGDFYISLDSLVSDPLAKLTFTLSAFGSGTYRVSNLKLTAGPTAGIHIQHPRFIIFSATGATPDSSDALSTVDVSTVNPSTTVTVGSGNVLLANLPASAARLALAFQVIEKVNANPNATLACKNYTAFNPAVKGRLSTCAALCHSPTATDARASQATGAFNMAAALGNVDADLQRLCVYSLGRLNLTNLAQSVLIVQPQPVASGGTTNHPYKLDTTAFPGYQTDVTNWGMGEK